MGPKNSTLAKGRQQQFFSKYQIIQQVPSQNIRFLQHKQTNKQYLLRQLNYNDKKQFQKAIQTVKNKKQQLKNADHITTISDYFQKQVDGYCSNFYKVYVLFQYPQRTLDDEITQRNLKKNSFTQTELWSILASCILGLGHLQKKGIRHSTLKSNMIFLSQQGYIKISDPFTTGSQTNYQTLLNKRAARHIYLSPQQCQALQNQEICPTINTYKSDIFTLGMIMLECGLLQYQDQCYRDQCSRIHWETIQYNKNRFRRAYSDQLANMLDYMLGAQANNRPEWIQLQNYVITDNTGKSFISQARKSNLIAYSRPVSVNINKLIAGNNQQPIIHTIQKPLAEQKNGYSNNTSMLSKGLRVSSSKPMSVLKTPYQANFNQVKKQQIINQFHPTTIVHHLQSNIKQKNIITNPPFVGSNLKTVQTNFLPSPVSNIKFQSPTKYESKSKRLDIKPLNISNINHSRPFKSIFPNPFYQTKTKADQNLVQLQQDQQMSQRSVSISSNENFYNSNINRNNINQQIIYNNPNNYLTSNNNNFQRHYNQQLIKLPENNINMYQAPSFIPMNNYDKNKINIENIQKFQKKTNYHHNNIQQHQGQFVIETFKLGSRYQGYKLNGMRHGPGKFFYQDGGMYDGNWVRNKMEGHGKLHYQSGKLAYEGQWVQDQFKGHGILYNQTPDILHQPFNYQNFDDVEQLWTKYQGQFQDDSKNGKGILYLSNGQSFQGNFVNDTAQGQGIYTTINGKKIYGIWENNHLIKLH